MANTKVTQHVIADDAITTSMITDANVTPAKLHGTLDLSSKTITLPSAQAATTQSASDNSTKIATTAYVTTALANLVDSSPSDLNTLNELAAALNDDASFSSTVTTSIAAKLPLAGGTMTGDLILGDNVKIEVGSASGGDLQIYHNGSHSFIDEQGTGGLIVRTGDFYVRNPSDADMIYATSGGAVKLYHNNSEKLETTAYGVSASGTGALKLPVGTTGERPTAATGQIRWNSTDGALEVYSGSAWTAVGTGSSNKVLNTFTGDGSTAAFTLTVTPANEDALMIFIDGVYQEKGDYSLSSAVLTLDTAPASGEKIACHITTASVHDGTSAVNQQFTGDGSTTDFTLSSAPGSENNTQIYINGVYQQKTDYTVSGTTLAFDTAPSNGDIIEVNSFTVATLGNTDTVTEGSTNLYHTTARTISALSGATLTGNLTIQNASSPTLKLVDTTQSSDLRLFAQDSNVGIGTFSNHAVRFYTNSTSRLAITNAGNVGIATDSPDSNLHIKTSTDSGVSHGLVIERSANTDKGYLNYQGGAFRMVATDGDPIKFGHVSSTDRFVIASDGAATFGSTINGLTLAAGSITSDASSNFAINTPNSLRINIDSNNSATDQVFVIGKDQTAVDNTNGCLLTVLESGKVGIGTVSPGQQLTVSSSGVTYSRVATTASTQAAVQEVVNATGGGVSTISYSNSASGTLFGFNRGAKTFIDSSQETVIGTSGTNFLSFATNSTERMRISSGGEITTVNHPIFMADEPAVTAGDNNNVIIFGGENHDIGGHYNQSNGRFTAPVAGRYFFTVSVLMDPNNTGNSHYARLKFRVNGTGSTKYAESLNTAFGTDAGSSTTTSNYMSLSMSTIISLGANDYVDVTNSGTMPTYGTGYGSFAGFLVG